MKNEKLFTLDETTQVDLIREMEQLKEHCRKLGLPMLAVIPFTNTEKDTKYHVEILTPKIIDRELTKDSITPYLLAFNEGFRMVPNEEDDFCFDYDNLADFGSENADDMQMATIEIEEEE